VSAPQIPISKPFVGDEEMAAIVEPLRSGWVSQGPLVGEFERRFADFAGVDHAVATTSCTTALHVALAALRAGPGDEVIVPAFTWVATPNAVEYVGARPVFCDVELDSYNVDPAQLEGLVTERTVGLLPVHLFGRAADMAAVNAVAKEHGLWVLEDAACALGTRQKGLHAGAMGDAGCFSFHPRKSITTGEGGMLATNDSQMAALARSLRDHGGSRSDLERHSQRGSFLLADYDELGFNYRMTDIQGALGSAQMERADWILAERARVAARYHEALAGLDWLRPPTVPDDEDHGWQSYVCLYAPEEPTLENAADLNERRNRLMAALEDEGIATRPGTLAPVETGFYTERYGLRAGQFPAAHLAQRLTIALPLYAGMDEADQQRVVDALERHGA
jgi:dTDP-4-amino-4,6-dideoxygalactose transaminase